MYITMSETGGLTSPVSLSLPPSTGLNRRELFSLVLSLTGVHEREILSPFREKPVVYARWSIMLTLRRRGWSTPQIGKFLGRDHSTIVDGLRRARQRYDEHEGFRAVVDALAMRFGGDV